mgnify:CR=1 FL=1
MSYDDAEYGSGLYGGDPGAPVGLPYLVVELEDAARPDPDRCQGQGQAEPRTATEQRRDPCARGLGYFRHAAFRRRRSDVASPASPSASRANNAK